MRSRRNQIPDFTPHQRNLGILDAMYGLEFDQMVDDLSKQIGNRHAADVAVRHSYASMMDYLKNHPEVPLDGDPRQFVRHHVMRAAMVGAESSPRLRAALVNRRGRKSRRNPGDDELELDGYSYTILKPMIKKALDKNISVLVRGSPGIGKSSLASELAKEYDLPLIDIRLAQKDPTELGGIYFPIVDKSNKEEYGQMKLFPPDWALKASRQPALIFLDEINASTSKAQQAAAYQIVLERRVGNVQFHPETLVMAAGNLASDQAIVTPLSSALNNRFLHFVMKPDLDSWLEWADRIDPKSGQTFISHYVSDYLRLMQKQGMGEAELYRNDGKYVAFPSPRSWEITSKIVRMLGDKSDNRTEQTMIIGAIGPESAAKFIPFWHFARAFSPDRMLNKGLPPASFIRGAGKQASGMDAPQDRYANIIGLKNYLLSYTLSTQQVENLAKVLLLIGQGGRGSDGETYTPYNEFVQLLIQPLWRSGQQDLIAALCQTDEMKGVAGEAVRQELEAIMARTNPRRRAHGKARRMRRSR